MQPKKNKLPGGEGPLLFTRRHEFQTAVTIGASGLPDAIAAALAGLAEPLTDKELEAKLEEVCRANVKITFADETTEADAAG